ncbi:MAG: glycosyltransferase [Bacteroidales bacterium]|nr:glycosyltransferase [Bacteroidales bacterium]
MKASKKVWRHIRHPWFPKTLKFPNKSVENYIHPDTQLNSISIVTGTLNRLQYLPMLVANTVDSDSRLELVLVDGGSTDGSIEYIKSLNHPRIKLIEVGGKSSYSHFMNLGIRNASHELVCQWNDDVFLVNKWDDVFRIIEENDLIIFSWKKAYVPKYYDKNWILVNSKMKDESGEIVMNFGVYHKKVFRKIGMYSPDFHFYCADGDMSQRAWYKGYKIKSAHEIKVISVKEVAKTQSQSSKIKEDFNQYLKNIELYKSGEFPGNVEYL